MSYQQITIVGRLGAAPELRRTQQGTPVTSFSVAANKSWTDNDGNRQEKVTWFKVTCWRGLAENCAQYLDKGRMVLVTGEMQPPSVYQGRDGEYHASLDLTASNVQFLSGGERTEDVPVGSGVEGEDVSIPF